MTRYTSRLDGLVTYSRQWEVQRAPYKAPLPYYYNTRNENPYPYTTHGQQVNDATYMHTELTASDYSKLTNVVTLARSQAVSRLKEGRGAALGLTLLDWRKSLSMITGALKALIWLQPRKKLYYKKKSGDLFLEGVFGWLPLISDIYAAINVLDGAHRSSPVRGKSSIIYSRTYNTSNEKTILQIELGAMVGAQGRMSNPNLALLSDLGLINPAAVAWDAVPYSFIVNWFIPVGTYLESLTDLVGYDVENAYVTTFAKRTCVGKIRVLHPVTGQLVWCDRRVEQLTVDRQLGFPTPSFPPFQLPSADLFKSLVTLSLLQQKLQDPPKDPPKIRPMTKGPKWRLPK